MKFESLRHLGLTIIYHYSVGLILFSWTNQRLGAIVCKHWAEYYSIYFIV